MSKKKQSQVPAQFNNGSFTRFITGWNYIGKSNINELTTIKVVKKTDCYIEYKVLNGGAEGLTGRAKIRAELGTEAIIIDKNNFYLIVRAVDYR